MVTLYKNKADQSICNNDQGITLLSVRGKLFVQIVLDRLKRLAESMYPESQCAWIYIQQLYNLHDLFPTSATRLGTATTALLHHGTY